MSKEFSEKDIAAPITTVLPVSTEDNDGVEKHHIKISKADEAAAFVAGFDRVVTEEESARVRRKIDLHLLPLM